MQIATPNPPGWTPATPPITVEELQAVAATNRVLVVHCWAIWNAHDRSVDRIVQAVRPEFQDEVAFRSLDMDRLSARGNFYAWGMVKNIPLLLLFANGHFERRIMGVLPAERLLRETLQELLNRT